MALFNTRLFNDDRWEVVKWFLLIVSLATFVIVSCFGLFGDFVGFYEAFDEDGRTTIEGVSFVLFIAFLLALFPYACLLIVLSIGYVVYFVQCFLSVSFNVFVGLTRWILRLIMFNKLSIIGKQNYQNGDEIMNEGLTGIDALDKLLSRRRKGELLKVTLIAVAICLALLAWMFRYKEIGTNQGYFYRVDRWTGKTYLISGQGIYEIHEDGIHRGR